MVRDMSSRRNFHFCKCLVFIIAEMKLCGLEINIKLFCNVWLEGNLELDRRVFQTQRRPLVMAGLGKNKAVIFDRASVETS